MSNTQHYEDERRFWDKKGKQDYVSLSPYDQERILRWIGWGGGGRILDLGGGAGMVSRLLTNEPDTECVCLDISLAMLTHAPVPAVQGDALQLPFRDGAFDLVIAAAFLHHLPGQEETLLREMDRVLTPGGTVLGYDPNGWSLQNRIFMGDTRLRLSTFSPDERPIKPSRLHHQATVAGLVGFEYDLFSFRNARITAFEAVQRYLLSPLAFGPLRPLVERWFFWRARKPAQ